MIFPQKTHSMQIISLRTIHSPNVYHSKPVMILQVDLGIWTEKSSLNIPNFIENLIETFPGIHEHHCSKDYPGGFIERLRAGTYLGHIIEHIAIELSLLADIGVNFGKTTYAGKSGHYNIVTRFINEAGMRECLYSAVETVKALIEHNPIRNLHETIKKIKRLASQNKLGPSTKAILEAAEKRNIPYLRIGNDSLIQLGYGRNIRRIQAAVSDRTSLISSDVVQNKELTKSILKSNAIPVPEGLCIERIEELEQAFSRVQMPCVIKPIDGHHGQGVSLNIRTMSEAMQAFYHAQQHSSKVVIEEMCKGKDYRVLIINQKFSAAAERMPPLVMGDGKSTIQELIAVLNQDPKRGKGHEKTLTQVEIDPVLLEHLNQQGLDLNSVLAGGENVFLRGAANISSGGTAKDVTSLVNPQIKKTCERIARLLNLDICGIDLIHHDIKDPIDEFFKVIEVNAGPGLRMHLDPTEGEPQNVGEQILDMLYPENASARIPIISVTGTNGKTTVVRLISKILSTMPDTCVGTTTTDGIWIGNDQIMEGDTTGPLSSQIVLSDPAVDMAVLEVARGGLLRGGLAYDWSDVSVVTNIRPDHLGQDGIEDLEDLVWIKSLVAERVRENGWLVLNADDPEALKLKDHPRVNKTNKKIFLYSLNGSHPPIVSHLFNGGSAAWIEQGWIMLKVNGNPRRLVKINEVPLTLDGNASFQVSNTLAAVAVATALNINPHQIIHGLKAFYPSIENRGRLNLYSVKKGYAILDYGHNPDAINAIGKMLKSWDGYRKIGIFGLPGDRADHLIESATLQASNHFDELILRDDFDLRGRLPGEVPNLMHQTLLRHAKVIPHKIILNELEAIQSTLNHIKENTIVVIFYDEFKEIMKALSPFNPTPLLSIPQKKIKTEKKKFHFPNKKYFYYLRNAKQSPFIDQELLG